MPYDLYIEIQHDDIYLLDDNDEDGDETPQLQEIFEATPVYCYRNPLYGTTKIQVGFDPYAVSSIHIVFVRYSEFDEGNNASLRWSIAQVVPSRRCAKSIAEEIDDGEWAGEGPWMRPNCQVEGVDIYSLGIED